MNCAVTCTKKIFLIILALLTLSSCAQGDLAAGGGSVTTPPAADSAETEDVQPDELPETEPDISLPVETEPEEVVAEPIEEEFILKKRMYFRVPAEEVEAEPMKYTSYNVRGMLIAENDMYNPNVFNGDDIYWYINTRDPFEFEYYRYNIKSDRSEFLFKVPYSLADGTFEVVNGNLICAPGARDDDGNLVMPVYCYDLETNTGTPETIISIPAATPEFNISALNDTEAVFFMYAENDGKTADMVYKYNTETKELSVFYENYDDDWSDMTLTTRNVLRMTARDNKVYLLMYQGIDGSTVYSVDVYSADGEKIDEYDIGFANDEDILKEYPDLIENLILDSSITSVREFFVFNDDYALIFNWCKLMDSDLTWMEQLSMGRPWELRLCKLDGASYVDLKIGEYAPKMIAYQGYRDDRYLVMASGNEEIDLLILDSLEGTLIPVELDVPENIRFIQDSIAMNEEGDIIMVGQDENADNKKMYLLNLYDDIIELVESYQHVVTLG